MSIKSWIAYAAKFIVTLAIRGALDTAIPGLRRALDFAVVVKNFCNGEWVEGVINLLYAIGCLVTLGALNFVKDALGRATKEFVTQAAKKFAPSAEMGAATNEVATKQAAKKIAPSAERRATNKVGTEQASRDLANIVVNEVIEEIYSEGIKIKKCVSVITGNGFVVVKKSISAVWRRN